MANQTQAAPLAQRHNGPQTIKDLLEAAKPKIASVIPRHLDPERLMRVALVTISRSPMLAQCTPESLLMCFMQGAELGLSFGTAIGEAYLVPFRNNKTNRTEATFIVGYRGLAALARRSGTVQTIQAEVVRTGDEFDWEYGLSPKLRHKPTGNTAADITHAWACVTLKDGGQQFVVLSVSEVNGIRARSKARDSGPWVTDFPEMAKKTAFRRLAKWLQLSPEFERAVEHDIEAEESSGLIDVPALPANGDTTKSAEVAETIRRGKRARLTHEPEQAPDDVPPMVDDQQVVDETLPPVAGEPDDHERVVISFMEARDCSREVAIASLDAASLRWFNKSFSECKGPQTLGNIAKRIGNPAELPTVTLS